MSNNNRIQLKEGFLTLPDGVNFPITLSFKDVRSGAGSGGFSQSIDLDGTKENSRLLGLYFDVDLKNEQFDRNIKTECTVIQNGVEVFTGFIQLMKITRINQNEQTNSKAYTYKINVFDEVANFFISMGEKELTDLSFPDLNHVFNRANIIASWDNTSGYIYPQYAKDHNYYTLRDFKPAIFELDYFNKIFASNGYTYDFSQLTDDDIRMDKRFIPFNGKNGDEETAQVLQQLYSVRGVDDLIEPDITETTITDYPIGWLPILDYINAVNVESYADDIGQHVVFDDIYEDAQSQWDAVDNTIINKAGDQKTWSFLTEYDYDVDVKAGSGIDEAWKVGFVSGGATRCDIILTLVAQSTTDNSKFVFIDTQVIKSFEAGTTYNFASGYQNLATGTNASTAQLGLFDNNEEIRITPLMFARYYDSNGNIIPYQSAYTVIGAAEPNGLTIAPSVEFLNLSDEYTRLSFDISITDLNIKSYPDINELTKGANVQVDRFIPKDIKQKSLIASIQKSYNLVFEPDPDNETNIIIKTRDQYYDDGLEWDWTDKFEEAADNSIEFLSNEVKRDQAFTYSEDKDDLNEAYQNEFNEVYGETTLRLDNEYTNGTDKKELIYAPTPSVESAIGKVLPAINGVSPENKIRVLLNNGKGTAFPYPFYDDILPQGTPLMTDEYLASSMFDNDIKPNFSICFDAPLVLFHSQQRSQTTNYLYPLHHQRETTTLNQGSILKGYFYLTERDFQKLSKRLDWKIFIKDNGRFFISKVVKYNAGKNTLTKVELVTADDRTNLKYIKPAPPLPPSKEDKSKEIGSYMTKVNDSTNIIYSDSNVKVDGRYNFVRGDNVQIFGDKNTVLSSKVMIQGDQNEVPAGLNGTKVMGDSNNVESQGFYVDGTKQAIEGETLYKARISQSGTSDPDITEFINNTGETITVSRTAVGTYLFTGFNGQLNTSTVIKFEGNGFPEGSSIKIFSSTGDNNFILSTYDDSDTISDGILLEDSGVGLFYFNAITIEKY